MNRMKKQKYVKLKDDLPRSIGVQYGTEKRWQIYSRKNAEIEPKQKQRLVVDVTGDGSKSNTIKRNIA